MSANKEFWYLLEPKRMSEDDRLLEAHRLYNQCHVKIFAGTNFDEFYHTVFIPPTLNTKVMVYIHAGMIVGYASFHIYEAKLHDTSIHVIMSEMGTMESLMRPVHRPFNFVLANTIAHKLANPFQQIYLVDTLISPYVYKRCCNGIAQFYPRIDAPTPARLQSVMSGVAAHMGWNVMVTEQGGIVRELDWKITDGYLNAHIAAGEHAQYYQHVLPDYQLGKGLVVVSPVTYFNVIMSTLKNARYFLKQVWHHNLELMGRIFRSEPAIEREVEEAVVATNERVMLALETLLPVTKSKAITDSRSAVDLEVLSASTFQTAASADSKAALLTKFGVAVGVLQPIPARSEMLSPGMADEVTFETRGLKSGG